MSQIIHFTSDIKSLKSILTSRYLRLHYCKEDFCLGDKIISKAVHPMICFSEYEISTIDSKTITYGRFGIAFSKSWVEKNKIHPVMYIDNNSLVAQSLGDLLIARRKNASTQLSPKVRCSIMTIKCFTKNSKGYNSYLKANKFDFKNENEWRYVPTKKQIGGKLISQDKGIYLQKQDFYNNQLITYPLPFSLNDLEFIFVQTQEQREEILKIYSIDKNKIKISRWKTKST